MQILQIQRQNAISLLISTEAIIVKLFIKWEAGEYMDSMANRIHVTELFGLYGPMLTEKQYKCLSMYLDEDFSLSEIGEDLGVSRQAVHDLLSRARQKMEDLETELGLAKRQQQQREALNAIYEEISQLANEDNAGKVKDILAHLEPFTSRA